MLLRPAEHAQNGAHASRCLYSTLRRVSTTNTLVANYVRILNDSQLASAWKTTKT